MMELPAGKQGAVLSDGMGSGEEAYRESAMVVDMLEERFGGRFPCQDGTGNDEYSAGDREGGDPFSTIDISNF